MPNRQQLETDIFNNVSAMRRLFLSQTSTSSKAVSPTHAQMSVMFAISHKSDLGVKDLAKCFVMTSSGATQLINGLVKRGWVKRETPQGDRRKVILTLSATGQRLLKKMIAQRAAQFAKHLQVLSVQELQQLKSIQNKMLAANLNPPPRSQPTSKK